MVPGPLGHPPGGSALPGDGHGLDQRGLARHPRDRILREGDIISLTVDDLQRLDRRDITRAVQRCFVERHGYSVVREYAGHGVGAPCTKTCTCPTGGRTDGAHFRETLPGRTFAIEPMISAGRAPVRWSAGRVVTQDRSLCAPPGFYGRRCARRPTPILTLLAPRSGEVSPFKGGAVRIEVPSGGWPPKNEEMAALWHRGCDLSNKRVEVALTISTASARLAASRFSARPVSTPTRQRPDRGRGSAVAREREPVPCRR